MKLILIRHGQTEWNAQRRIQGTTDIPLNALGRAQAAAIAKRLAGSGVHTVYSSPLSRAHQTAEAIAHACGCAVYDDERLVEIRFGVWEGLRYAQIMAEQPALWADWHERPNEAQVEGAESFDQIRARTQAAVRDILARHGKEETVALVSHAMPIKLLIGGLLGIPDGALRRFWLDNCAYSALSLTEVGEGRLLTLNETGFLPGEA